MDWGSFHGLVPMKRNRNPTGNNETVDNRRSSSGKVHNKAKCTVRQT